MRLRDQPIEVRQIAEERIDGAEVSDVIAEVRHRRLEERRDPDRVDAQSRDIIQPLGYPPEIAYAIAIGIEEAARIDLVDHRSAPPGKCAHALKVPAPVPTTLTQASARAFDSAYVCAPEYVCSFLHSIHAPRMIQARSGARSRVLAKHTIPGGNTK